MLNFVHYIGNANLNYNDLPFLTYQTGKIHKFTAHRIGKAVGKYSYLLLVGRQSDATTDKGHLAVYNTIMYAFIL